MDPDGKNQRTVCCALVQLWRAYDATSASGQVSAAVSIFLRFIFLGQGPFAIAVRIQFSSARFYAPARGDQRQ